MTRHILGTDGVIGDFHGDAAMGFWGWPLTQRDAEVRAAVAANNIRTEYARQGAGGFRCGIGIASGRAVAGQIGTVDQVKVTAFGPVVNLASRLEGMTKVFGAPVIVDKTFAERLRAFKQQTEPNANDFVPPAAVQLRIRRLARVRPAGFESSFEISELLSSRTTSDDEEHALTEQDITNYECGLDAMVEGNWSVATDFLKQVPSWDSPKQLLMSIIESHDREPPGDWDGVISLAK